MKIELQVKGCAAAVPQIQLDGDPPPPLHYAEIVSAFAILSVLSLVFKSTYFSL